MVMTMLLIHEQWHLQVYGTNSELLLRTLL